MRFLNRTDPRLGWVVEEAGLELVDLLLPLVPRSVHLSLHLSEHLASRSVHPDGGVTCWCHLVDKTTLL